MESETEGLVSDLIGEAAGDEIVEEDDDEEPAEGEAAADDLDDSESDASDDAEDDPEDEPDGEADDAEPQKVVPLPALHEERAKSRRLRDERDELKRQLAEREAEPPAPDDLGDDDPDKPLTRREYDQLEQRRQMREEAQRKVQAGDAAEDTDAIGRGKYTAKAEGKGLTWDDVVKTEWIQNLSQKDRAAIAKSGASGDAQKAAKLLYDLCVERSPRLQARFSAREIDRIKDRRDNDGDPKPKPRAAETEDREPASEAVNLGTELAAELLADQAEAE